MTCGTLTAKIALTAKMRDCSRFMAWITLTAKMAANGYIYHRVETYRDVTDRRKHCGRLRYHVPTLFQATGRKMINCACSASLK
jgi:hypothetical protein